MRADLREERAQLGDLLRLLRVEIVPLREVAAEVEKFAGLFVRRVVVGRIEPRGDFRDGARFGGDSKQEAAE